MGSHEARNLTSVYADLRWPADTGIGVVSREVLARVPDDLEITPLSIPVGLGSPFSPLALWSAMGSVGARKGVFWSPGFIPPITAPIPRVITVHDLTHLHFYSKAHAFYYRAVYRRLFRAAERLICVSRYTADELCEWCGLDSDRVDVVHNAVSDRFRPRAAAVSPVTVSPYILYAGNRRAYKNLDRLIRAFALSGLAKEGFNLEFTGAADPALQKLASDLGFGGTLRFSGRLTDDELATRYAGAHCIAFVSLYEGFGLPILEGMASGVPVLTSNVSSMPEIAAGAALIVDPYSVEAIADGLRRLCLDSAERARLVELGLRRVHDFSWDRTASATWAIVRSAASR